jgi:hypothetical protein
MTLSANEIFFYALRTIFLPLVDNKTVKHSNIDAGTLKRPHVGQRTLKNANIENRTLKQSNVGTRKTKSTVNIVILLGHSNTLYKALQKLLLLSKVHPHQTDRFQYLISVTRTL